MYGLLSLEAVTAADLAAAMNVHLRTAQRHLAALAEHHLAEKVEGEGWVRGPANPDEVAEEIGTAGMRELQRRQHEIERQLHADGRTAYAVAAQCAPYVVDDETGEIIYVSDLLAERPSSVSPECPAHVDVSPVGACRRCGLRTGLRVADSWICSRCEPFHVEEDQVAPCRHCYRRTGRTDSAGAWCCSRCSLLTLKEVAA